MSPACVPPPLEVTVTFVPPAMAPVMRSTPSCALSDVDAGSRMLISNQLIPQQQRHLSLIEQLMNSAFWPTNRSLMTAPRHKWRASSLRAGVSQARDHGSLRLGGAAEGSLAQVVGVGPGVRARHIFAVGLDLGLPTGALATLAAKSSAQNAYMVSCLLANHGFVYLEAPFIVQLLPAMLAAARGAVFNGIPPYDLWEHPPAIGKIPPHFSRILTLL